MFLRQSVSFDSLFSSVSSCFHVGSQCFYANYFNVHPTEIFLVVLTYYIHCHSTLVTLADALFANPERLLNEQLECYAYLYAYASVTIEEIDLSTERRLELDRSDVVKVSSDIMEASRICKHVSIPSIYIAMAMK